MRLLSIHSFGLKATKTPRQRCKVHGTREGRWLLVFIFLAERRKDGKVRILVSDSGIDLCGIRCLTGI